MEHRNGFSPIALSAEHPVAQAIGHSSFAFTVFLQPFYDLLLCLFNVQSVEYPGVDHDSVFGEGLLAYVPSRYDLNDWKSVFPGKLPVALVVGRYGHDGPRAIGGEDVISDPDRDSLVIDRIYRICSRENTRFFAFQLRAFQVAFRHGLLSVLLDGCTLLRSGDFVYQFMFGASTQ